MASIIFNDSRAKIRSSIQTGSKDLIIVLLKAVESDNALANHTSLSNLLGASGNTECDFTNYVRKVVTFANITVSVDNSNNRLDIDIPDQVWSNAGNGTNNTIVKLVVCIDGGSDSARIPITAHDLAQTTNGGSITVTIPADGFYRSQ